MAPHGLRILRLPLQEARPGLDDAQDVVEVVGDARGQGADGLEALGLHELVLHLPVGRLRPLPFGDLPAGPLEELGVLDGHGRLVGHGPEERDGPRGEGAGPPRGAHDQDAHGPHIDEQGHVEEGAQAPRLDDGPFLRRQLRRLGIGDQHGLAQAQGLGDAGVAGQGRVAEGLREFRRQGRGGGAQVQVLPLDQVDGPRVQGQQFRGAVHHHLEHGAHVQGAGQHVADAQEGLQLPVLALDVPADALVLGDVPPDAEIGLLPRRPSPEGGDPHIPQFPLAGAVLGLEGGLPVPPHLGDPGPGLLQGLGGLHGVDVQLGELLPGVAQLPVGGLVEVQEPGRGGIDDDEPVRRQVEDELLPGPVVLQVRRGAFRVDQGRLQVRESPHGRIQGGRDDAAL